MEDTELVLISRQAAIEKGLPRYFTGIPCKNNHVIERYSSNTMCVVCHNQRSKKRSSTEEAKQKKREYDKLYTKKPEVVKRRQERWANIKNDIHYIEERKAKSKEYRKKNKDVLLEKQRNRSKTEKYRELNKKASKKYSRTEKGRTKKVARTAQYRADKAQRTPKWVDAAHKNAIKKFYADCHRGYDVDHIIPLRGTDVSGLHVINNLQYLPSIENRSIKKNKFEQSHFKILGKHLVCELYECDFDILNNRQFITDVLLGACKIGGAEVLGHLDHQFYPYGVTSLVLLSTSHCGAHSWPEEGYCALDIFTCSDIDCYKMFDYIHSKLGGKKLVIEFGRGIPPKEYTHNSLTSEHLIKNNLLPKTTINYKKIKDDYYKAEDVEVYDVNELIKNSK